jgi:hypothetical protein
MANLKIREIFFWISKNPWNLVLMSRKKYIDHNWTLSFRYMQSFGIEDINYEVSKIKQVDLRVCVESYNIFKKLGIPYRVHKASSLI